MSQGNRGAALENLLNHTNAVYLNQGRAVVHKRPTPVKILRSSGTRILSAVLESKSTVDYEGCYRGHSLQFEAKSTKETERFPLVNIHDHQVEHMRRSAKCGAIAFLVVEFSRLYEVFYLPGDMLFRAWDEDHRGGRKSISYDDISAMCYLLKPTNGVPLDYLSVVDKLIQSEAVS